MHIVVCAKQILDPETPASAFRIEGDRVVPAPGIAPVLSQFDAIAAEAALRVKEARPVGDRITVLSDTVVMADAQISRLRLAKAGYALAGMLNAAFR